MRRSCAPRPSGNRGVSTLAEVEARSRAIVRYGVAQRGVGARDTFATRRGYEVRWEADVVKNQNLVNVERESQSVATVASGFLTDVC